LAVHRKAASSLSADPPHFCGLLPSIFLWSSILGQLESQRTEILPSHCGDSASTDHLVCDVPFSPLCNLLTSSNFDLTTRRVFPTPAITPCSPTSRPSRLGTQAFVPAPPPFAVSTRPFGCSRSTPSAQARRLLSQYSSVAVFLSWSLNPPAFPLSRNSAVPWCSVNLQNHRHRLHRAMVIRFSFPSASWLISFHFSIVLWPTPPFNNGPLFTSSFPHLCFFLRHSCALPLRICPGS